MVSTLINELFLICCQFLSCLLVLCNRFQVLKRDLQDFIGTRANINIAQIEDYGGETFLSEEVAIAILQEAKLAFQRCQVVSGITLLSINLLSHKNKDDAFKGNGNKVKYVL